MIEVEGNGRVESGGEVSLAKVCLATKTCVGEKIVCGGATRREILVGTGGGKGSNSRDSDEMG